ncbi:MAG: phage portal protein [Lachnospiraceae bacterium]|nr:phage portal protein [Lachnospiraceae bacterium]
MSDKPNFRERALYLFNPDRGNQAYRDRIKREQEAEATKRGNTSAPQMSYGSHGASTTLNSMVGWLINSGNAEDNIDLYSSTLRQRARDLYEGGGLARSGPQTLTTSVVGWGILPKPKIDAEYLGISDEAAEEAERTIAREFKLWADNVMCDAERQQNFYGIQQLAFLSMLMSGDVFALFGMKENKRTPYQTTIRLLEADRICKPDSSGVSESGESDSGGRIIDGVEIDQEGAVIRYHVASRSPIAGADTSELTWTAIDAFGKDTGYPNILHVMTYERPEQRRGVPFVAAEIEQLKQFSRYMNAELASNVVSAMLTCFITSEEDDGKFGMEDAINDDEKVTNDDLQLELAPGAIYNLPPGKDIKTVNPLRSNAQFETFVNTCIMEIASSMGIPKEVLVKKYESNYTAARAALLDFWRTVRVYRTRFNTSFNQPVYEQWLSEAVATGRIEAPGFFDDPAIRQAWCGCVWMGASMGHVDPLKEVNAASARIANNITTQEQEASEYNGNDWAANVRQRKKEIALQKELYAEFAEPDTEEKEDPEEEEEKEDED